MDLQYIKDNFPYAYDFLQHCKYELKKRKLDTNDMNYYKYSASRSLLLYEKSKLLVPDMLVSSRFDNDSFGEYYH